MTDRKLTLKEAVLKCLEETGRSMKYKELYEEIEQYLKNNNIPIEDKIDS